MKSKHIVFFDGDCPLCNYAIRFILAKDKHKIFMFAPLQGKTAATELVEFYAQNRSLDTLVLIENYGKNEEKTLIEGKAILRICWHLKGIYSFIGWISFLPSFLFDIIYRVVARYRHKLFSKTSPMPNSLQDRLLS